MTGKTDYQFGIGMFDLSGHVWANGILCLVWYKISHRKLKSTHVMRIYGQGNLCPGQERGCPTLILELGRVPGL